MAERDAFGREIGEDTLAEAGWRSPAGTPDVEVVTSETSAPPPSVGPPSHSAQTAARRGRGAVGIVVATLVLAVVGVTGVVAVGMVKEVTDAVDEVSGFPEVSTAPIPDSQPVPAAPDGEAGTARGLDGDSLLRPARLRAALRTLDRAGGRSTMLRLAPDRIDTQLYGDRGVRIVQVGRDGKLRVIARPPLGAVPPGAFDPAAIDPTAPRRLLRAAEARHDLPTDEVDYLVYLPTLGAYAWNAYYRGGSAHVQGDQRGRLTRRAS